MLKIRLQKVGKKNAPSYRVVLAEHTAKPQGKFIEILGSYNPRLKQKNFKKERIEHWLNKGAQPSPTVHNLLVNEKIIEGEKLKAWRAKVGKEKIEEKPKIEEQFEETKTEEKIEESKEEIKDEKSATTETQKTEEVAKEESEQSKEGIKPEKKVEEVKEEENKIDKEVKID